MLLALLGLWEAYGRYVDPSWVSQPTLILDRVRTWALSDLGVHIGTTVAEMLLGLSLGAPAGILGGLLLGRSRLLAALLRPILATLYSIPLITLAPLFILWFGLGMQPKVVLVGIVSFFLVFFNTFAGAQAVDRDLVAMLRVMGASKRELFQKLIAPACAAWIITGLKIALPYALIAATVGEMLAARQGLGYLLIRATSQIDMTGVYAALLVLMVVGVIVGECAARLENWLLRWRAAGW